MKWPGHYNVNFSSRHPYWGWDHLGAMGWFRSSKVEIYGHDEARIRKKLYPGNTYMFKMRVEYIAGHGDRYSLKIWEQEKAEPAGWDVIAQKDLSYPNTKGSLALVSHHVDATFGNISITPIN